MINAGSIYLDPKDISLSRPVNTAGASGWSVTPTSWGWQWSAYSPLGSEYGTARTKDEAERYAQQALRRLRPQSQT